MRTRFRANVAGEIRTLFGVGVVRDLSDGQLLERFATGCNESAELAFAVLVEHHGPMVLRVCRGMLVDPNDRDDAFQATFLVLVKKARGLWVRDSLGPWLHQVAVRTATALKSSSARRRKREALAVRDPEDHRESGRDDLVPLLHEEIERLPERFRAALVLCDLQGCSHEQAARHLGWPIGTVKSRQARGRQRLRERLFRRGITADAGQFALMLSQTDIDLTVLRALMESTTAAALHSLTRHAVVSGSSAALAQGVLRSMFMTYWLKVATILVGVGLTASGVGSFLGKEQADDRPEPQKARDDGRASMVVTPGKLSITVSERGVVEASRTSDVYSKVEGLTTILSIVPEGTLVKKGQLVCELDSSSLKDQETNQVIAIKAAQAEYERAKLGREVAEIALVEYIEGVFKSEWKGLKQDVALARMAVEKAEARLARTRAAREKWEELQKNARETPGGVVVELDLADRIDVVELTIAREKSAMELAESKLANLEKYVRDRTIKTLKTEVEKARTVELMKQSTWELEKSKEEKLLRQIKNCKIVAPGDGIVVYANDLRRFGMGQTSQIEEGATIRERQKIFSLPDLKGPFRVNANVHESIIDRIVPGLRAKVTVDAFPDLNLIGAVGQVAPLPNPGLQSGKKVYTTFVDVQNTPPGLRPGMTAQVEILVSELDNVLSVVKEIVHGTGGKGHLVVLKPGSEVDWREVTFGKANEDRVEIKSGLQSGERVSLIPLRDLKDDVIREIIRTGRLPKEWPADRPAK